MSGTVLHERDSNVKCKLGYVIEEDSENRKSKTERVNSAISYVMSECGKHLPAGLLIIHLALYRLTAHSGLWLLGPQLGSEPGLALSSGPATWLTVASLLQAPASCLVWTC